MWTSWWFPAAILTIVAEGIVRVPLRIGRRNGTIADLVLSDDPQMLGAIIGNGSTNPWPQTLYTSQISTDASNWLDIKMALQNGYDNIYFIDAQVGTPGQSERMIVDTGSSDMWLVKTSYGAEASSTSTSVEEPVVTIHYGMGAISGSEVTDRVCFAGLCIDNQAFVLDTNDSMHVEKMTDGLFGLAYPALAVGRGMTLLQNLQSNGPYKNFTFALSLRHWDDAENSSIVIGELQDVLMEAPRAEGVTLPLLGAMSSITGEILPPMWWAVRTLVSIGPGPHVLLPGVLDSGTSMVVVPEFQYVQLLYALIGAEHLKDCFTTPGQPLLCPCGTPVQPMNFAFRGTNGSHLNISLTAEDLLLPMPVVVLRHGRRYPMQACRLGLMAGPPNLQFWILGDVFLRKVYAVHDVFGRRVMLFPQRVFEGQTKSIVGMLDEHARRPDAALALLLLTAMALTLCAVGGRFHRQAKVSEVDGYHHF